MRKVARVLVALVALVVVAALAAVLIGLTLPEEHTASVRARFAAPADSIYALIADVERSTAWRSDLQSVDVVSDAGEPLRWREVADWGALTFERASDEPGRRVVNRIVDEGQGFGGTWTFELEPDGSGTSLHITEDGRISNPVYRFMSRFVMGYHASMESYARDLGARLRETPAIERL